MGWEKDFAEESRDRKKNTKKSFFLYAAAADAAADR